MEYYTEARSDDLTKKYKDKAYKKAYKWLIKASNQNYPPANFSLANLYKNEEYEFKSLSRYRLYLDLAANQGYAPAIEKKEAQAAAEKAERKRKAAEAARYYDFKIDCPYVIPEFTANTLRAKTKYSNKQNVVIGNVVEISSNYVELSGVSISTIGTFNKGACLARNLTESGKNYAIRLNKNDRAAFKCTGRVAVNAFDDSSVWFYDCSEYKP